ncbi:hypothetical protein JB92DRAFT_2838012 [Gautieria morchelliformis]|nr:hypothetical protein JB92DRAFT_2838012 [Gautieria morchelliformis]
MDLCGMINIILAEVAVLWNGQLETQKILRDVCQETTEPQIETSKQHHYKAMIRHTEDMLGQILEQLPSEVHFDDNVDDPEMDGDITNSAMFIGYNGGMLRPTGYQRGGEGEAGKKKSKKKKKNVVQPAPPSNPPPVAIPAVPNPIPPTALPALTVPMPASHPPPATLTHTAPLHELPCARETADLTIY